MNDSSRGSQSDNMDHTRQKMRNQISNIEDRKNTRDTDLTTLVYLPNE